MWRVIDTGLMDAAANMAIDEAILLSHTRDEVPPTLRLYGWKQPAVSLGYFQKSQDEIDLEACAEQGIPVVRRMTGGRAVLHDAELTYSLVVKENSKDIPKSITASYRYFSGGLIKGLNKLGIKAQMNMPRQAYGQGRPDRHHTSAACFDASSHYEVTYEGKKLIGSAQVRKQGVILQHGSILLRFSPEKLIGILKWKSPAQRAAAAKLLAQNVASLELAGQGIKRQTLCSAIISGFSEQLGINLIPQELSAEETAAGRELAAVKYSQASWNLKR
ncbi:MAG: biotin/lipoate A/B protein ligase family protein [Veillonellales bacterium]